MIKYICTDNCKLIKFNKETEEVNTIGNIGTSIDWLWIADEDGELNGIEVNKGDIVYSMYPIGEDRHSNKREAFVIKDEKLRDYYFRMIEFRKQEMSKRASNCDCESISCGPTMRA